MGNRLCKRKSDGVVTQNGKSQRPIVRIINRLHLRPNSWKSESQLNQKQDARKVIKPDYVMTTKPLSKSSDWTDVDLQVPEEDPPKVHLRNPKLSQIFDENSGTPTPPPRKHKRGIRETLEAVAKNGLQAFQSRKPAEEPLCVKKYVKPTSPDDHDCALHPKARGKEDKETKRRKNLSIVSLPNYNDLKLTVANFEEDTADPPPDEDPKKITASKSMPRCRSFGSLLPQQILHKLKVRKAPSEVESDDSFGPLEDWDLRLIEHYDPKDASLPRPRKAIGKNNRKTDPATLLDIENLVEEHTPVAPVRKSESFARKINREFKEESARHNNNRSLTPPSTPEFQKKSKTTPLPNQENGVVEHSSLLRILEEFSVKDKEKQSENPQNLDYEKRVKSIQDFILNEKINRV